MPQVLQTGTSCIVIKHTKMIKEERGGGELVLLAALQLQRMQFNKMAKYTVQAVKYKCKIHI
jgi:hypothetical protein